MAARGVESARTILIVEDDPAGLILLRDLLEKQGYLVLEATNGREGGKLAGSNQPDLILMDMHMLIMNGYEATQVLKLDPATQGIPDASRLG